MENEETMPAIMGVEEVMHALSISRPYAYRVIRMLNAEMEEQGYHTLKGKVSRSYFFERYNFAMPGNGRTEA